MDPNTVEYLNEYEMELDSSRPYIAIVTETFPPEVNGVANTLGHLVGNLQDNGVDVQVIRPKQNSDFKQPATSPMVETLQVQGLPIPGYKTLRFGLPCRSKIEKSWKQRKPDGIYVATEGPLGWSAVSAASRLGLNVVSGFHTNFQSYVQFYGVGWLENGIASYLKHFHNRTLATLTPTLSQKRDLESMGLERVTVMGRGIDTALFNPEKRSQVLRASWGVKQDDRVFIHVGRVAGEKNIQTAINCYNEVEQIAIRSKGEQTKMVVVGDGPLLEELKHRNPNIIFAGVKKGKELAAYYASADVMMFPSLTDTFGNVVLEAMASGLAVHSFDVAAPGELLENGRSGLLAKNETEYLSNTIRALESRTLVKVIGQEARNIAEQLSWDQITSEFVANLMDPEQAKKITIKKNSNNSREESRPYGFA